MFFSCPLIQYKIKNFTDITKFIIHTNFLIETKSQCSKSIFLGRHVQKQLTASKPKAGINYEKKIRNNFDTNSHRFLFALCQRASFNKKSESFA